MHRFVGEASLLHPTNKGRVPRLGPPFPWRRVEALGLPDRAGGSLDFAFPKAVFTVNLPPV